MIIQPSKVQAMGINGEVKYVSGMRGQIFTAGK